MKFMSRRRNPRILGEDLGSLAFAGGGLAGTAAVDDKIVAPFFQKMVPQLYANQMMGKLFDAATTFGTAWLLGKGVGMLHRGGGGDVRFGGSVLALGRGISAFIPSFQISASVPTSLANVSLNPAAKQPASEQIAAGINSGSLGGGNYQLMSPLAPASPAYSLIGGM